MSKSGPAPGWNRNAGSGCQRSGPGPCIRASAVCGTPIRRRRSPPGGLQASAEPGVGRAAEQHPAWRPRPAGAPGDSVQGERLLRPDVLTGRQGGRGDLGVRGRDGQVDHDLDVRAVQRLRHRSRLRYPVRGSLGLGPLEIQVGTEHHAQVGERGQVVQVLVADGPAADDGDTDGARSPARPVIGPPGCRPARPGRERPARPGCRRPRSSCRSRSGPARPRAIPRTGSRPGSRLPASGRSRPRS